MESALKHKISLSAQLSIALGWFSFLFYMGTLDQAANIKQIQEMNIDLTKMKLDMALFGLIAFMTPTLLISLLTRGEKQIFLNIHRIPNLPSSLVAITICIIALPAVAGLHQWNTAINFSDSLKGLEQWIKIKEDAANEITKVFSTDKSINGLMINLFVMSFMAALSEEFFFRGLLQRLFQDNNMNTHIAVWLTAILFSAIHFQFLDFLPRMFLGAILGYLYAFTNNLWVPIMAHFANNAFIVIMSHFYEQATDAALPGEMDGNVSLPLTLLSIALVGGQLWFVSKTNSKFKIQNSKS